MQKHFRHKKNGLVYTKPFFLKLLLFVARTGVEPVTSGL